jgi:hypothetical protein
MALNLSFSPAPSKNHKMKFSPFKTNIEKSRQIGVDDFFARTDTAQSQIIFLAEIEKR